VNWLATSLSDGRSRVLAECGNALLWSEIQPHNTSKQLLQERLLRVLHSIRSKPLLNAEIDRCLSAQDFGEA
jgi:hypothetical protein